jgi:hypothetical protein
MALLIKSVGTALFLCGFASWALSQTFEIRVVPVVGSTVVVEMRETSGKVPNTSDILADLVFGICWDKSYGIQLDEVQGNYTIQKSGPQQLKGSVAYQLFAKEAQPANFPSSWRQNEWQEIIRIANNAASDKKFGTFSICPEAVYELNINYNLTDYAMTAVGYADGVRIGVQDLPRTGVSTSVDAPSILLRDAWSISPNPGVNKFEVSVISHSDEEIQLNVTDATGKMIFSDIFSLVAGANTIPLLLSGASSGMYRVSLLWKDGYIQSKNLMVSDH